VSHGQTLPISAIPILTATAEPSAALNEIMPAHSHAHW
jgi:hypothetical protein